VSDKSTLQCLHAFLFDPESSCVVRRSSDEWKHTGCDSINCHTPTQNYHCTLLGL